MAGRKKKTAQPGAKKLRPEDIKRLWKKVPVQQWYMLLQSVARDQQWTINGHTRKGCCPYHDDKTPSFYLNFDKCLGKCFGSCGKVVTDLVQLFAKLKGSSYVAALTYLNAELKLNEVIGEGADELAEFNALQEMKKSAAEAMRSVVVEYIRDRPGYLDYLRPALAYLTHGRRIPLNLMETLPIGVFAKPEHLKKYIPEIYHTLFDTYFAKVDGRSFWGAPCFHYNDAPGSISRFKLRRMKSDAFELCSQYENVGDMPYDIVRNLADKAFMVVEDPFIQEMGVFGMHHYNRMIGDADANAYITEGEFDALSVMVAQMREERIDFMIFAVGGNGSTGLSFLRELGIRTLWLVQDAPSKHGDDVVKRLFSDGKNFVGDSVNKSLMYKVFQWGPSLQGGDLDEAVQLMGYENVCQYLYTDRASYFINAYNWVVRKCDEEIAALKLDVENLCKPLGTSLEDTTKRENLENTLVSNIAATIKKWFGCIHDQVDKITFIQKYTVSEGIDFEKLQEVNNALYDLDTMAGAVSRLQDALRKHVEIVYYESTRNGNQFTLWSKSKYETSTIPMSDSGMELVLSQYLGKDVLVWAKQLLNGSPILCSKPSGDDIVDNQRIQKNILFLLRRAMMDMVSSSKQRYTLQTVGQGIHYNNIESAKVNGHVYFVNGTKVFRGTYNPSSGAPIEWEFLNNVVDENIFFKLDPGDKWSVIDDVSELYSGTQVDLKNLFDQIRTILDGWKFDNHEVMRDYLAAWIMSLPIQRAIGVVNITFLTGESTSGKTSFVGGLLGGYGNSGFDVPYLVESARFSSDATPAWVYQEMDQSALLLSLDEAEARQDNAHSTRVKDIQQIMFSIPTGGARMTRGGSSSDMRSEYFLQMPVIMAAINMSSDPVFLTRVVVVYTQKDLKRKNVGDYIADRFSEQQIKRIRKEITTGLLAHIPALNTRMMELRGRLSRLETAVPVTSRFINSLLPGLVVYDFLGFDAETLFQKMVSKNQNLLEALNSKDFQSDIINAVLYTESIKTTLDDNLPGNASAKTLIMSGEINILNNSECGVKFLPEKGWIIIFWRDAKHNLLRSTTYRHMDEASLREAIAKNNYVVTDIRPADHKYIVTTLGRTDIKHSAGYSVISAEYLLTGDQQEKLATASRRKKKTSGPATEEIPISAYEQEPEVSGSYDASPFSI